MGEISQAKLVTFVCPTCGYALRFDSNNKYTTCSCCKNQVEKQCVINLNYISNTNDSAFINSYTCNKSMFSIHLKAKKELLNKSTISKGFLDNQRKFLSADDAVKLDSLIAQFYLKFDNPNNIIDISQLWEIASKIKRIDDNNVYAEFMINLIEKKSLKDVLIRKDSLDKAKIFIPYLITQNKLLANFYDEDLFYVMNYIINTSITEEEKLLYVTKILSEKLEFKHSLSECCNAIDILLKYDFLMEEKQNLVKKVSDIFSLNNTSDLLTYLSICQEVKLNVENQFSKKHLIKLLKNENGVDVACLIDFIAKDSKINKGKKVSLIKSILDIFLNKNSFSLTALESANLIESLINSNIKEIQTEQIYKKIVTLTLVEKINIEELSKEDSKKILKEVKKNNKAKCRNSKDSSKIHFSLSEYRIIKMHKEKQARIANATEHNREMKKQEEFENSQLIAYLIESKLSPKLKKVLIDSIKIPYYYESYKTVVGIMNLIYTSNYEDKENLFNFFLINCLNLKNFENILMVMEFVKRTNLTAPKKDNIFNFLILAKAKFINLDIVAKVYLNSYFLDVNKRFKSMFLELANNNKDLFYQLNNIDIIYDSGDINNDTYLLIIKCMEKFALQSVVKDHIFDLLAETKQRLLNRCIFDFSNEIKLNNKKIIKWLEKKPLSEKEYKNKEIEKFCKSLY